ncbi:hypothetical protein D3C80_947800 [compost metagenome]
MEVGGRGGAAQDDGAAAVAGGLAQGAGGLKRPGAPVDQVRRRVRRVAEGLDRAAQFGFESGGTGGQQGAQGLGRGGPVGQVGMAEGRGAGRLDGGLIEAQAREQVRAILDRQAQDIADKARIQHGRGKGGRQLVGLAQRQFDGFQLHIGEAQIAQGGMIDPGRPHQGATAE